MLILIITDLQLEFYYYNFYPLIVQKTYLIKSESVDIDLYFLQTNPVYTLYHCSTDLITFLFSSNIRSFRSVGNSELEMTTTRVSLLCWTLSLQIITQSTRNGKCSQIMGEQSQLYLHTNTNTISIRRLHLHKRESEYVGTAISTCNTTSTYYFYLSAKIDITRNFGASFGLESPL